MEATSGNRKAWDSRAMVVDGFVSFRFAEPVTHDVLFVGELRRLIERANRDKVWTPENPYPEKLAPTAEESGDPDIVTFRVLPAETLLPTQLYAFNRYLSAVAETLAELPTHGLLGVSAKIEVKIPKTEFLTTFGRQTEQEETN